MLEELILDPVTKEQLTESFENINKAFIERAMGAEMSYHLGYGPGQKKPEEVSNHRNCRGLIFKFPNSNTENLRYHLSALHTEILIFPSLPIAMDRPDRVKGTSFFTLSSIVF